MNTTLMVGGPLILIIVAIGLFTSGILSFGVADLEPEVEAVDYRTGSEPAFVRKVNGLSKYTHITLKWPIGTNEAAEHLKHDTTACVEADLDASAKVEAGQLMYEIDPPVLTIPAR